MRKMHTAYIIHLSSLSMIIRVGLEKKVELNLHFPQKVKVKGHQNRVPRPILPIYVRKE